MVRFEKGFTLMEILVVLGIALGMGIAVLTFSIPQLQASQTESMMVDMTSIINLYQQNAYAGKNDKSYGVYFGTSSYTLFIGESYATAESVEEVTLSSDTTIETISFDDLSSEIVFSPGSFRPSTSGFVRFSNGIDTFIFEINGEGLIYTYKE